MAITSGPKVIREIEFHKGLNLIIDESEHQVTGNNVGKTTVLKLIDFCLGADARNIYVDTESRKTNEIVKNFLVDNKVLVTLELTRNFEYNDADNVIVERNFLPHGKELIRKINGKQLTDDEFE